MKYSIVGEPEAQSGRVYDWMGRKKEENFFIKYTSIRDRTPIALKRFSEMNKTLLKNL